MANDCIRCEKFCADHYCEHCCQVSIYEDYLLTGRGDVSMEQLNKDLENLKEHTWWCDCIKECGDNDATGVK